MRTPKLWIVLPLFLVLLRPSAANEVPEPLPTPATTRSPEMWATVESALAM